MSDAAHTASGRSIKMLPVDTRVRDSQHRELTGRITEHTFCGKHVSSVPYVVAWDDEQAAEGVRGIGFRLGTNDNVVPVATMTVNDAVNKGVKLIRKPAWNPYARLETPDGSQTPWARLHDIDPAGQVDDGQIPIRVIDILLSHADDGKDDWEEWVSPAPRPTPSSR